jgi:hypothetical protein
VATTEDLQVKATIDLLKVLKDPDAPNVGVDKIEVLTPEDIDTFQEIFGGQYKLNPGDSMYYFQLLTESLSFYCYLLNTQAQDGIRYCLVNVWQERSETHIGFTASQNDAVHVFKVGGNGRLELEVLANNENLRGTLLSVVKELDRIAALVYSS